MKLEKKILIIAYACESDKGSEPAVGWNWTKIISQIFSEVYVLTRSNNVESIKTGLEKEKIKNVKVIGYDLPYSIMKIKKRLNITRIYYYIWQIEAIRYIKKLNLEIDIIQHVTFVNDYIPSLFYKLKCEKFIWGPIGSNEQISVNYEKNSIKIIKNKIKYIYKNLLRILNPDFKKCIEKSDLIIGTTEDVKYRLKNIDNKFINIPAIGIEDLEMSPKNKLKSKNIILFVGNLVPIKNPCIALEGYAKYCLKNLNSEFWVVGEGPELESMKKIIHKYKIEDNVKFLGRIKREDVVKIMRNSDIVIFPTLESAGFVTLESMVVGTPVISLDLGGPSKYLVDELQIKTNDCYSINCITDIISNKIEIILDNYMYYSNICINESKKYTWDAKKDTLKQIYNDILIGEGNV